jgi:hypothetical protein
MINRNSIAISHSDSICPFNIPGTETVRSIPEIVSKITEMVGQIKEIVSESTTPGLSESLS